MFPPNSPAPNRVPANLRQGKLAATSRNQTTSMPFYIVSHFTKALMSDEDADKLTAFLKAEGVPRNTLIHII